MASPRIQDDALEDLLTRRGWLRPPDTVADSARPEPAAVAYLGPTGRELEAAVLAYQAFHGLQVDGHPGPVTHRSLTARRFCDHPDVMLMGQAGQVCAWDKRDLTYNFTGRLLSLPLDVMIDALGEAWSYWEDVCGITATWTSSAQADVKMVAGGIDRAGGTRAWSELPCGSDRPLGQKYDSEEPWGVGQNPGPRRIDLVRVAAHEIGHVLGLPHLPAGNLLQPTYDQQIRRPQPGDVREVVRRYGQPTTPPPGPGPGPAPVPGPTPPGSGPRVQVQVVDGSGRWSLDARLEAAP